MYTTRLQEIFTRKILTRNGRLIFAAVCYQSLHTPWETWWLDCQCAGLRIELSGLSPGRNKCIVFLDKTIHSQCAILHSGVGNGEF